MTVTSVTESQSSTSESTTGTEERVAAITGLGDLMQSLGLDAQTSLAARSLCARIVCVPYMCALYVCLACVPDVSMYALHVCLMCMPECMFYV